MSMQTVFVMIYLTPGNDKRFLGFRCELRLPVGVFRRTPWAADTSLPFVDEADSTCHTIVIEANAGRRRAPGISTAPAPDLWLDADIA
jgi:hypothetical protein